MSEVLILPENRQQCDSCFSPCNWLISSARYREHLGDKAVHTAKRPAGNPVVSNRQNA
jgi:hypothetical protein